jgi:SAM-dependent methyltransferase
MANQETVRHYDAQYGQFASRLYAEIRSASFGEDIGQNGWLTADEHDIFISWLALAAGSRLLDVASGSGGTTLRIARLTGALVQGIDIHAQAVAAAVAAAGSQNLGDRATFRVGDAGQTSALRGRRVRRPDLHRRREPPSLTDRRCSTSGRACSARAAGWCSRTRSSSPGHLTNAEIAVRASIGFFLFVPAAYDERPPG